MESESKEKITVVLADDHSIVINGFSVLLTQYDIEVIGAVNTAHEVISLYEELSPSVLILDIRFGDRKSGLDIAKELLQKDPNAKIIFLSQFDQNGLIKEAYNIGALAYLTKNCHPDELVAAIKSAAHGITYFPPDITKRLLNLSFRKEDADSSLLDKLESRELKVFVLMAQGFTNAEMAEKMDLSLKLISNISHSIKGKLNLTRTADLTRLAIEYGYIEP